MIVFEKRDGSIIEKEILRSYMNNILDGRYVVQKYKKARSNQQNKYYWFILSFIAHETGDLDFYSLHEYIKMRFMKDTTTDMDTIMFTEYIDFVRQFALYELGVATPDALI